jgi:hypothetical protein
MLVGIENLQQCWDGEGMLIDREIVEYLRSHDPDSSQEH